MRKLIPIGVVIAVVIIGISAYYLSTPPPEPEYTVRIHWTPFPSLLPYYVAEEKGFFAKNGIKYTAERIFDTGRSLQLMSSGELDVGAGSFLGIFLAAESINYYAKILYPLNFAGSFDGARFGPQSFIIVRADSPIRTVADLKGKKIGVGGLVIGNTLALRAQLKSAGIDPDRDVQILVVPTTQHLPSVEQRQIDAAIAVYPFVAAGLQQGSIKILAANIEDVLKPQVLIAAWVADERFLKKYPQTAKRVIKALTDSIDWINNPVNAEETITILAKFTNIDAKLLKAIPSNFQLFKSYPNGFPSKDVKQFVTPWYELARKEGFVKKELDMEKFVWAP